MPRLGRVARWILVLGAFVVFLVAAGGLLLSTDAAHRYILAKITQRLRDVTGGDVEIGSFSFHRAQLGADFYGIIFRGLESDSTAPLFSADHTSIDLGLHLFRSHKIDLRDITLDRPVMRLTINSEGDSNLPRAHRTSTSGNSPNIFDLAIGHFVMNRGEVFYNDRHSMVGADIRNLNAQIAYGALSGAYDGTLDYHDARVQYGSVAPIPHDLHTSFSASTSGIVFKSLTMQTSSSTVQAHGQLTNYAQPSFNGVYQATLSTTDIENLFNFSGIRNGQVNVTGTIAYDSNPGGSVIDALTIAGTLRGTSLNIFVPQFAAKVQDFSAEYQLDHGNLDVRKIEAAAFGGHADGQLSISRVTRDAAARLQANVKDSSMSGVQSALRATRDLGLRMSGSLSGNVQATWNGSLKDFRLSSDAKATGSVTSGTHTARPSLSFPVEAVAHISYDEHNQSAEIRNGLIHSSHASLMLQGGLGQNANLKVDARSDDLRELDLLISAFQVNSGPTPSQPLDLAGAGTLTGMVSGRLSDPQIAALVTATDLHVRGASVQSARANVRLASTNVTAQQGEIRMGPQSSASFDASLPLRDWHLASDQPLNIRLRADKVSVADIERLAGLSYPVTGILSSNLAINGTQQDLGAQGNINISAARAWEQPIQNITISLQNAGNDLSASVDVRMPAGAVKGTLSYHPKTRQYDVQADTTGIQLNQIQYLQTHSKKVTGVINASVKGRGTLDAPEIAVTLEGPVQIGDQKIDGFKAQASVAQRRSQFSLDCSIAGAQLQARGAVDLTGDYQTTANVDSQPIHLDSLLSTFLPQTNDQVHGQTEFHGTLQGPLKDPNRLVGHFEIPSLSATYSSIQLASVSPIRADYQQGDLSIQEARLKGTGTDFRMTATIPFQSTSAIRASVDGNIDLQLLQLYNPQWQSSGQVTVNVSAQGSRAHPDVKGTVAVSNAGLSIIDIPALEKINGELDINGQRIQVKTLTGQLGGGSFEAHGFAAYEPTVRYNLGMTATGVRLLYPDGLRSQFTADLNWTGQPSDSLVSGQVVVNRLSLTQSFDLATFADVFSGTSVSAPGAADNIKLNVGVTSSRDLEVSNNQLNIEGTADLHVQGTVAEPVIIGRTSITGGELFFNGKRFQIQNASIVFANPTRTQPVVNLTATTIVNQFNLTVNLVGPFDRLNTTYTSDPPLSQVDVINLLITGHTTAQATSTSPESVIASQLSGQVSNRLQKLTGISSLTIDPQIGGNQGNAGSQLAIQERVTKNLFFTFATDVTTTQGQVVQVEYQVTPKYSVSAIRDQTGGYQIEVKSHKTF